MERGDGTLRAREPHAHHPQDPPRPDLDAQRTLRPRASDDDRGAVVIILGIILLILGFVLSVPILWTLGIILVVIGVILFVLGAAGREIGGRKHWY
jgi:protein-S-isoprenylcysteine O-methyltransferase Ste14